MKAFISYSHHDAELLTALHQHLSALRRQNLLQTWTDRDIDAGGVLDSEIAAAMEEADLFLFLISSSFLNSDYCYDKEFKRALERHAAKKAVIVPIIVRPCDWKIPELQQFKALPHDGNAVQSKHWHSVDEAFANVATGLRTLIEKRSKKALKFVPDDRHVTEEQRKELNAVHKEIVDRLIVRTAKQTDEEVSKAFGIKAGQVWNQFHAAFGTAENKLASLPKEKFDAAKQWLLEYRGSQDRKYKRANPQKYRNALTKTIYTISRELGWPKEQVYSFAVEKLECATPVTSLNDLGNSQLELLKDRIRYEKTKKKIKSKKAQGESK